MQLNLLYKKVRIPQNYTISAENHSVLYEVSGYRVFFELLLGMTENFVYPAGSNNLWIILYS